MCDMTHSYVWHASSFVTCYTHMCDITHPCVCHDWSIHDPWLIHACDITHLFLCHDAFKRVPGPMRSCPMTHSCVWHDASIRVPWRIHTCAMTHFSCAPQTTSGSRFPPPNMLPWWLIRTCALTHSYVPWRIRTSLTHTHISRQTCLGGSD